MYDLDTKHQEWGEIEHCDLSADENSTLQFTVDFDALMLFFIHRKTLPVYFGYIIRCESIVEAAEKIDVVGVDLQ
jgi:hypothetical protein